MILAIALAITTLHSTPVAWCSEPGSPTEELAKATAVFSGKVVGRDYVVEETPSGEIAQRLVIKIGAQRVWKGDIKTEVTMYTSQYYLPNGHNRVFTEDFRFDENQSYLLYAFGKPDQLWTNKCTRSRPLSKADGDLEELGDSHAPKARG
jgi:hypothetical protein